MRGGSRGGGGPTWGAGEFSTFRSRWAGPTAGGGASSTTALPRANRGGRSSRARRRGRGPLQATPTTPTGTRVTTARPPGTSWQENGGEGEGGLKPRPQLGHASVLISSPAHSLATPIVRTRPLHSAPPPSQATPPNPQPRPLRAEHALPLVQSSWFRPLPQTTPVTQPRPHPHPFIQSISSPAHPRLSPAHNPPPLPPSHWPPPSSRPRPPSRLRPPAPHAPPTAEAPPSAAPWLRPPAP